MKQVFLVILFAFFLSATVACGYYYFFLIPEKIERNLAKGFRAIGFEDLKFETLKRKTGMIVLSNITLDENRFSTIEEVSIHYTPMQVFFDASQAHEIKIKNMHLTGTMSDDLSLNFTGWQDNSKIINSLSNLPARVISVEQGRADVLSDRFGGLQFQYDLDFTRNQTGSFSVKGYMNTKQHRLAFQTKIDGIIGADGLGDFSLQAADISVDLASVKIRRGTAKIMLTSRAQPSVSADFNLASLMWRDLPLSNVKGLFKGNNSVFDVTLAGSTFGPEGIPWESSLKNDGVVLKTKTFLKPERLSGLIEFAERNKAFDSDMPLPHLSSGHNKPVITIDTVSSKTTTNGVFNMIMERPEIEVNGDFVSHDKHESIHGRISLPQTTVALNKGNKAQFDVSAKGVFILSNLLEKPQLEWSFDTDISNGEVDFDMFKISNIKGTVPLKSTQRKPRSTTLPFSLPIKSSIAQGGHVNLNLFDPKKPLIGALDLKIYGGYIKTQEPIVADDQLSMKNKLVVSDISIAQLLHDAGFEEIFVSGALGGVIPMQIKDNEIDVNGGILQSQSPGIIKLPDDIIMSLFPGDDAKAQMTRESLRNYHYEYFELRLDGDLSGRMMMTLNANGENPDLKLKDPVDINLQIETQISVLFDNLLRK